MKTKTLRPTSEHGFTLVEVLVASLILAIGLMGVATMIARSTLQDSRAYYMSRASTMMEEFVENSTKNQYDSDMFGNMTDVSVDTVIDGVAYRMDCSLQEDTPIDKTKEMTCTIQWNNKGFQTSTTYVYVFAQKY